MAAALSRPPSDSIWSTICSSSSFSFWSSCSCSRISVSPSISFAAAKRTGSCALELCDIARGRAEALFEWRLQPWDTCAGTLLVEEAGGRCGQILEGDVTFTGPVPFLAANSESFDKIRSMLQSVYAEWSARKNVGNESI